MHWRKCSNRSVCIVASTSLPFSIRTSLSHMPSSVTASMDVQSLFLYLCALQQRIYSTYRKVPPPLRPQQKNGSCLNVCIFVTSKVFSNVFSISETKMVPVHDYEKRHVEAFAITKMRTFIHEPFFIGVGGGYYSWYFTLTICNVVVIGM